MTFTPLNMEEAIEAIKAMGITQDEGQIREVSAKCTLCDIFFLTVQSKTSTSLQDSCYVHAVV